jgi:hypothetical protein
MTKTEDAKSAAPPKPGLLAVIPWPLHIAAMVFMLPLGAALGVFVIEALSWLFPGLKEWSWLGIIVAALMIIGAIGSYWQEVRYRKRLRRLLKEVPDLTGEFFPLGRLMQIGDEDNEQSGTIRHMLAATPDGFALLSGLNLKSSPYGTRLDGVFSGIRFGLGDIARVSVIVPDAEALNRAHRSGVVSDAAKNLALGVLGVRTRSSVIGAFVVLEVSAPEEGIFVFGIPADYQAEVIGAAVGSIRAFRPNAAAGAIDGAAQAAGLLAGLEEGGLSFDGGLLELSQLTSVLAALAGEVSGKRAQTYAALATARIRERAVLAG